ncbi:hypothetical protein N656DRAFT_778862 [Canariomyces notabilis]|uniref:Uncharacterized protein n=1 Tax=Canariomyces notabilis TaxID=2074819 RepID=A0AAN6YSX6_9PEZI|nr:hypothetical protein N656DRAFT_778862 [Canariomyces arenarius]
MPSWLLQAQAHHRRFHGNSKLHSPHRNSAISNPIQIQRFFCQAAPVKPVGRSSSVISGNLGFLKPLDKYRGASPQFCNPIQPFQDSTFAKSRSQISDLGIHSPNHTRCTDWRFILPCPSALEPPCCLP